MNHPLQDKSMIKAGGFPGRYVQGPGAIRQLAGLLDELGCRRGVVIADAIVRESVWQPLVGELAASGVRSEVLDFPGECTEDAMAALAAQAQHLQADCVIGLGGGKTIDTAKGVSQQCDARLIIAPTIASNDSPTSRLIVVYDAHHRVSGVKLLARNPDVVLVDTAIVARAPARFFAAGLGDALSKRDEVSQCHLAGGSNFYGTPSLATARLLAEACHRTVLDYGAAALARVREHATPDDAVERVVEATVLLSGLAFESGGLSIAHSLSRGFTAEPEMSRFLHGELIAFGSIVQQILQQTPDEHVADHACFVASLDLPICFADFDGYCPAVDALARISQLTAAAPYSRHITPPTDADGIARALKQADELGQTIRQAAQQS